MFVPRSRFYPKGVWKSLSHPRRLGHTFGHAPVALRIAPFPNEQLAAPKSIALISYDREELGQQICLWFTDDWAANLLSDRWRLVANNLWRLVKRHSLRFHDVPVDIGDGVVIDKLPPSVFCFSRRIGSELPLLPNPYLMRPRKRLPSARPFEQKKDALYFRGSSTGSIHYDLNSRVSLCRTANAIDHSDCGISRTVQVGDKFECRMKQDGIERPLDPLQKMNAYRYLVDVDGNTSSWNRFLYMGMFGGVPIRYEVQFEECWHSEIQDGEHYIAADRHDLKNVVESLRSDVRRAKQIAAAASKFVKQELSMNRIHDRFEQAWLNHEYCR